MTWENTGISVATLEKGRLVGVELAGVSLVLVNSGDRIEALGGTCSHEGGILSEGEFLDGHITCPLHQSQFDVRTGAVVADPDGIRPPTGVIGPIAHYQVRILHGLVQVDLPEMAE